MIDGDDIVFLDFGPIFEEWEADFGRTFALGNDLRKLALRDDLPRIFQAGRDYFTERPGITGEQLFDYIKAVGQDYGWDFGGVIAGHLVGEFPHEKITGDEIESYIAAGSRQPMRRKDRAGKTCHWILEVHLVDRQRRLGGFHEELLDLPQHVFVSRPPVIRRKTGYARQFHQARHGHCEPSRLGRSEP